MGTELGVWGTNTVTGNTTPFAQNNTGMGNVRVDMLKIRGADKTVAVATHGRGVFTGQLINLLPVDFIWLKGMPLDNLNRLLWNVTYYGNYAGFEIERKYDGENTFTKVGYAAAKTSTSTEVEYGFDDNTIALSKPSAVYRLKQIDKNGSYKYSDQILIKRSQVGNMVLFVSASTSNLSIRVGYKPNIKNIAITILDQQGRIIESVTQKYQDALIDISKMPSGIYYVKVQDINSGEAVTNKFIK